MPASTQVNTLQRFHLQGLDCANCAMKIEAALRETEGLEAATISFVTSSMQIPPERLQQAVAVIKGIEPHVQVLESKPSPQQRYDIWHSLLQQRAAFTRIGLALLLLILGIFSEKSLHNKPYSYIEYVLFLSAYLLVGYRVLYAAVRNIWRGEFFDENTLMSVATVGAIAIHQLPEAVAVMLFYSIGEALQDAAVHRSRRSVSALLAIRPDQARVLRNDHEEILHPQDVCVGEVISVYAGERIPLDGEVTQGDSFVDTSALTGESVPRHVSVSQPVLAGMVATSGLLFIKVSKPYSESSLARILHLVEEASDRKAHTEKMITAFSRYYTPAVVGAALALAFIPPLLFGADFSTWLYRALILLVISCPCALVLSVPLSYFGGIGACARQGILVKGASFLDTLARLTTVAVDKTGTLTKGTFKVTAIQPNPPYSASELLALAANVEAASNHPIAAAILAAHNGSAAAHALEKHEELPGRGVKGRYNSTVILAGNDLLMHQENVAHSDEVCTTPGTVVHVAVDGQYAGNIIIADELRPSAPTMVSELRTLGIDHIIMLTGDDASAAKVIGHQLGISELHANLLPADKVALMEALAARNTPGKTVAFVGDGINDAPVLSRADVGIAMGGLGSDAAIEAADVVILEDNLTKLPTVIKIAKRTRTLVFQNIAFSLGVKGLFLVLGAAGVVTIWGAVFADVGVSLLAVLNATRILRFSPGQRTRMR